MSGEPKTFASLSSGLLARKGAARPAMRPQGFGQVGAGLDDLGWNDMGEDAPKVALTPVETVDDSDTHNHLRNPHAGLTPASPVHEQQDSIVSRLSGATAADFADEEDEIDETAELYEPEGIEVDDDEPVIEAPKAKRPMFTIDEPPVADAPLPASMANPAQSAALAAAAVAAAAAAARQPAIAPVVVAPVAEAPVMPARSPRPRSAPGTKGKAAFTLRLDKARHLKLRLACAVRGRSAQQMVTDALDAWLDAMPELEQLADKARRRGEG